MLGRDVASVVSNGLLSGGLDMFSPRGLSD